MDRAKGAPTTTPAAARPRHTNVYTGTPVPGSPPIDSTASVDPTNGDLYFGAGNAAVPGVGGYYAYSPNGTLAWNQVVTNPPHRHRERRRRAGLPVGR